MGGVIGDDGGTIAGDGRTIMRLADIADGRRRA
jgi:hypothetical protein